LRTIDVPGVITGSTFEFPLDIATEYPKPPDPVHSASTRAAAALSAPISETYSGEAGVGKSAG
jgi:hypothetical protein